MTEKYYITVRKVNRREKSYTFETNTNIRNLYRVSDIERIAREQFQLWMRDSSGKIPRVYSLSIKFKE